MTEQERQRLAEIRQRVDPMGDPSERHDVRQAQADRRWLLELVKRLAGAGSRGSRSR